MRHYQEVASVRKAVALDRKKIFLLNNQEAGTQPDSSEPKAENIDFMKHLILALLREVETLRKAPGVDVNHNLNFYDEIQRFETDLIRRALERTGGNQTRAARLLGIKLTTLNHKIKRYNIKSPSYISNSDISSHEAAEP